MPYLYTYMIQFNLGTSEYTLKPLAVFVGPDNIATEKAANDKADELRKNNPGSTYEVNQIFITEYVP
jgi:hypothetical protein